LGAFESDRKAASTLLVEYPALKEKLQAALSQSVEGYRLAWSNADPHSGAHAEHSAKRDTAVILIRVSANLHPADQILGLFYESLNAHGFRDFTRIAKDARDRLIRRDEFIDAILAVEHRALVRMKETCQVDFVLPAEVAAVTRLYRLTLEAPTDPHLFMSWYRARPEYARASALYGEYFDSMVNSEKDEQSGL
jgi:hypothetical protein